MYKACIFDLDGTLTDTLDSLVLSVNETLKEMGLTPITREQCRMFVGSGSRVLLDKALRVSGDEKALRIEEAMEVYDRIFSVKCTYNVVPYHGITELLSALKEMGMKLAVLSNKPDGQAVNVVESIFGKDTFDWIQGQREGVPKKPDPAAALAIAKAFDAEPSEVFYVGDSDVDIATGMAAKMKTIGVSWGFRDRDVLLRAGAENIVDTPFELIDLTKELLK